MTTALLKDDGKPLSQNITSNLLQMRFYCEDHGKDFYVSQLPGRVVCYTESEIERHYLGEFPNSDFWEYCCSCKTTRWAGSRTTPVVRSECPRCKSLVAARYVCDQCSVLTIDSEDDFEERDYTLVAGKAPVSQKEAVANRTRCPGCERPPRALIDQHNCPRTGATFWSARERCPFCDDPIGAVPSFPSLAKDFLARTKTKDKITVGFDILEIDGNVIVPSSEGDFVVISNGSKKTRSILLPRLIRFEHFDDGEVYRSFYDVESAAIGDVRILSPAIVKKIKGGWILAERGRLEVVAPSNDASRLEFSPIKANEYPNARSNQTIVNFDIRRGLLVLDRAKCGSVFVAQNPDGSLYLLPRVTEFSGLEGFQQYFNTYYQYFYDCSRPAAGDLWITSPALVEKTTGGWQLVQKGILEVRKPEPLEPPIIPPEITPQDVISRETEQLHTIVEPKSVEFADAVTSSENESRSTINTDSAPTAKRKWIIAAFVGALLMILVLSFSRTRSTLPPGPTNPPPPATPTAPENMVYVPGGKFFMGNDHGDEYEKPAHPVTVAPFFIDKYEVTCEQYGQFVKATNRRPPPQWKGTTYPAGWGRRPVTGIDWDDANAYARWVAKRLPTEEEWEFASRGLDGRKYPWGNEWKMDAANAAIASRHQLANVGEYSQGPSPFNAFDMAGNAWEWTASDLKAYEGGRLPVTQGKNLKVIRGGSWQESQSQVTTTYRGYLPARGASNYSATGFRCVKNISAAP